MTNQGEVPSFQPLDEVAQAAFDCLKTAFTKQNLKDVLTAARDAQTRGNDGVSVDDEFRPASIAVTETDFSFRCGESAVVTLPVAHAAQLIEEIEDV